MDLIKIAEEAFATGKQHPSFKAGDTVTVAYRIVEGNKERVQLYRGVVIKIAGHGEKKRFTVRKMSGTVGVERIFIIVKKRLIRLKTLFDVYQKNTAQPRNYIPAGRLYFQSKTELI